MAYTASIAIAVKGIQDIQALRQKIEEAAEGVNRFNNFAKEAFGGDFVRSINNVKRALNDASNAFDDAALGTSRAVDAAKAYIASNREMNATLKERERLLRSVVAAQGAEAMAKIGVRMPSQQLLLPAAAPGTPAMTGGARSLITGPVERLGGARTQDQADIALRFAQALQQQVRPLSQIQYLYAGIASQATKMQAIKALPDTAMLNASARGLQRIESIENGRIARLERIRQKLQGIAAYEASAGTMANAGFGFQGPAVPPGGIPRPMPRGRGVMPKGMSEEQLNAILGGAFPALFGAGPGAILGGVAGGAIGGAMGGLGGMALSVGLSAVGQQLDQMIIKLKEAGDAISKLDVDSLRNSFVYVNAELARSVELLTEAGNSDAARLRIQEEIAAQTGLSQAAQDNIYNSTTQLADSWNGVFGTVSSLVGILATPFINALSTILSIVNEVLKPVNIILSAFLQTTGAARILNEEEQKRLALLDASVQKQLIQLQQTGKLYELEKQRTLGITAAEKEINAELDAQIARETLVNEYKEKRKAFLQENKGLNSELLNQGLFLIDQETKILFKKQQAKDLLVQQRLEIERNAALYERAAQAVQNQISSLERANQLTQSNLSVESALNTLYAAQLDRQYELATTAKQRYAIAIRQFNQQVQAANIEYRQALANTALLVEKAKLESRLVEIKYAQVEAEKKIAIAQAIARGNTEDQINRIARSYDEALGVQRELVGASRDQILATEKIASNQKLIAAAVFNTKLIQAESALAQKLASTEIGFSKNQADRLAGSLAVGVQQAQNMAVSLNNVAASASVAANQLARVVSTQRTVTTTAKTSTYQAQYKYSDGSTGSAFIQAKYAKGGYVTRPTVALIAEGGEPEFVVPQSKAAAFAENWIAGRRGASAVPNGLTANGAMPGSAQINITTGPVLQQDNSRYVTVKDMEQALQTMADTLLGSVRSAGGRRYVGLT